MLDEVDHDLFQDAFGHLSMPDKDPSLGCDSLETSRNGMHILNAIVYKENLSVPIEFSQNRVPNEPVIKSHHARLDGHPFFGWRLQIRNITNTQQGHVKRPWYRGSRQG